MKKIVTVVMLLVCAASLRAQDNMIEKKIRFLEQVEVKAVLVKDTAMLLKLWDKNFVVNNPDGVVVFPGSSTLDRPVLRQSRASFVRNVEQVIVKGNVAFSMGSEIVVAPGDGNVAGKQVKRRYTNIWINENGNWKLAARHANVICPK